MLLSSLIPAVSPTFTGVLVGAISGALAFVTFAFVLVRRRARERRGSSPEIVVVPPYAVLPAGRGLPGSHGVAFTAPVDDQDVDLDAIATRAFRRPRNGFSPQLSASALSDMGLHIGPFGQRLPARPATLELDFDSDLDLELDTSDFDPPAVTVAPCIIISDVPPPPARDARAPHPLGVIPASSAAMKAALAHDDCPTEIGETFFDVPPKPLARAPRPKIRPVAPAAPRFNSVTG
jgi:hypothetical protein